MAEHYAAKHFASEDGQNEKGSPDAVKQEPTISKAKDVVCQVKENTCHTPQESADIHESIRGNSAPIRQASIDDSGVQILSVRLKNEEKTRMPIPIKNVDDSIVNLSSGEETGYKSPELVEESESFVDAYSIIQVRDAVEQLDRYPSEDDGADDCEEASSNASTSNGNYPTKVCGSSSSNLVQSASSKFQGIEKDDLYDNFLRFHTQNESGDEGEDEDEDEDNEEESESDPDVYEEDVTCEGTEDFDHSMTTSNESVVEIEDGDDYVKLSATPRSFPSQAQTEKDILPKRGKKRAQEEIDDDCQLVIFPQRLLKIGARRSHYPPWLHKSFHISDNSLIPQPSRRHLELLRRALEQSEPNLNAYAKLFQSVFGSILCMDRESQMLETVQAVHARMQTPPSNKQGALLCNAARELLVEDRSARRYLGNFASFNALVRNYNSIAENLPGNFMVVFDRQLLEWYSSVCNRSNVRPSSKGSLYDLWAKARKLYIYQDQGADENIPLHPEDLSVEDRTEWISTLSQCKTLDDAREASEEIFGPLSQVDDFPTPDIELEKFWRPCECGICKRSRKRVKLSQQDDKENGFSTGEANSELFSVPA